MAGTQTGKWAEIDGFPLYDNDRTTPMIRGLPRLSGIYNSLQVLVGTGANTGQEAIYRVLHFDSNKVKGEDIVSVAYVGEVDDKYDVLHHPVGYGAKRLVEASAELIPQEAIISD